MEQFPNPTDVIHPLDFRFQFSCQSASKNCIKRIREQLALEKAVFCLFFKQKQVFLIAHIANTLAKTPRFTPKTGRNAYYKRPVLYYKRQM